MLVDFLRGIMILGALFGFIYALRLKELYSRILNWTMVVAVGITFIPVNELILDGYRLFALTLLGVVVYAFSGSNFSNAKKLVLAGCGILTLIPAAFMLSAEGAVYFEMLAFPTAILHLGLFGYALKTDIRNYKEEMGFLIIMAADALVRFVATLAFYIQLG